MKVKIERTERYTPADFRFLRAFVQGAELKKAWDTYALARVAAQLSHTDVQHVAAVTRRMLDDLASIARRHGLSAEAAILQRDPQRMKSSIKAVSSSAGDMTSSPQALTSGNPATSEVVDLATFVASRPELEDFSEAEQIELLQEYLAEREAERRAQKAVPASDGADAAVTPNRRHRLTGVSPSRTRLMQRMLATLDRLEPLASVPPRPDDRLDDWIDAKTAQRLSDVGIHTCEELLRLIRNRGARWYRRIPRVGEVQAARMMAWMHAHSESLGMLPAHALAPHWVRLGLSESESRDLAVMPQPGAIDTIGIAPIERLKLPRGLDGFDGQNRAPVSQCAIAATDDLEAVRLWLRGYEQANRNTWLAYRKEAERLLLWSVFERSKPLSGLDHVDLTAYWRFLESPPAGWCARGVRRWAPDWRPLEGPLGPRALTYSLTVAKMLCEWLTRKHYLATNPFDDLTSSGLPKVKRELRALTDRNASLLIDWMSGLAEGEGASRLRLIMMLGLAAGLRGHEIAAARVSWLKLSRDDDEGWVLEVLGKGNKPRRVPLLRNLAVLIAEHLKSQGLPTDTKLPDFSKVAEPDRTPLVSKLGNAGEPLSVYAVRQIIKEALRECAASLDVAHGRSAERIASSSSHSLRHTFGRRASQGGLDAATLADLLGHGSIQTTAIYSMQEDRQVRAMLEKALQGGQSSDVTEL